MNKAHDQTAIEKILSQLLNAEYSTSEMADVLELPVGTVRSTISLLNRLGLIEAVPKKKRGKPFKITQKGRDYLKEKQEAT